MNNLWTFKKTLYDSSNLWYNHARTHAYLIMKQFKN